MFMAFKQQEIIEISLYDLTLSQQTAYAISSENYLKVKDLFFFFIQQKWDSLDY